MRKKNSFKILLIISAFAALSAIGSAMAYLSSSDARTNTFTVGEVKAALSEENWEAPRDLTPGRSLAKDPKVTNTGENPAFIFMTVKIPKKVIYTYDPNTGARIPEGEITAGTPATALFQINRGSSAAYTNTNTVDSSWVKVEEKTDDDDWNTLVYAYGTGSKLTRLAKGESTSNLFNSITYCYSVEGQNLENEQLSVICNAYAIQADNIANNGDNAGHASSDSPATVWSILKAQNDAL